MKKTICIAMLAGAIALGACGSKKGADARSGE